MSFEGSTMMKFKSLFRRGQGGSGSSKNNPSAAPPAAPLKNAASVSSLDSKHQKSGLLKFSGSKDRGLDTRTLGKEKTTKKFLGSREKGIDREGSKERGLDKLVPTISKDRGLDKAGSSRGLDRSSQHGDIGSSRLGHGEGPEVVERRTDNLGAASNFDVYDDGHIEQEQFARADSITRARNTDFNHFGQGGTLRRHPEVTRGELPFLDQSKCFYMNALFILLKFQDYLWPAMSKS